MPECIRIETEEQMRNLGAQLVGRLAAGDVVFLFGELGAGKTTLVRGLLAALGWQGPVRSPTFNLINVYETDPPVLHADLYRLQTPEEIGLHDEAEGRIALIEWPERFAPQFSRERVWRVSIAFDGEARQVQIEPPKVR